MIDTFFVDKNYDGLFLRNAQIAVLQFLNCNLKTEYIENNKKRTFWIPFILGSHAGDERYFQDYFMKDQWNELKKNNQTIDGILNTKPLGILTLDSISISPDEFTNRHVFVERTVLDNIDNLHKTEMVKLNRLPISMSYSIEIKCNTLNEIYRLWENFLHTFYKNKQLQFMWKQIPIYAQIGFSEDANIGSHSYEISFGDEAEKSLELSLEMETYFPVLDESSAYKLTDTIQEFKFNITDEKTSIDKPRYDITQIDKQNTGIKTNITEEFKGTLKEHHSNFGQTKNEYENNLILYGESGSVLGLEEINKKENPNNKNKNISKKTSPNKTNTNTRNINGSGSVADGNSSKNENYKYTDDKYLYEE